MKFSVIYKPTTLFSLRDSNSTSSGAKSLFIPSPYAIKMAFLNQAISLGGEDFEDIEKFSIIRDAKISYHINGFFCVNNCFVKIQKQRYGSPFTPTISFREYIYLDSALEIIISVASEKQKVFLEKYLCKINQFGKRGCFFQFVGFKDCPSESNVQQFDIKNINFGILQEYDDFDSNLNFENVNSYSDKKTKRKEIVYSLPLLTKSSSKSYTLYQCMKQ